MQYSQAVAPVSGRVIPLDDVNDQVFSSRKMGDGFAIADPTSGEVVSPVDGKVLMTAKTGHAVGVAGGDGLQYLVHLGIDTVELEGKPFDIHVSKGDTVSAGEKIATMDLNAIKEAEKDPTAVVIITNSKKKLSEVIVATGDAQAGDLVAEPVAKREEQDTAKPAAASEERPADLSGFDATAWEIIKGIGGAENVRSVTHCITRVRFSLKDEDRADDSHFEDLDGVIDVVRAGGQYQVVIGPDVEDVYEAVEKQLGNTGEASDTEEKKERPTTAWGWFKYGFSELIGVITGSMIPVIGLLAASGIIKGILSLLLTFDVITEETHTYAIINAMSDAVFFFLPIFVGFTAARRLGADPVIVAIIGGVLTYPSMLEIAESEGENAILGMQLNADFFGLPFHMANYTYSIFPIIVAAWAASVIEPWLKKIIPNIVRMIFVPLFEVVIVSLIILLLLGPIVTFISTGIANIIQGIYDLSPTISGLVIGGFYQGLVIFGLHWAVIPLVAQDIAATGHSYLNAIISATMVAQGGAVLAVFVKTKIDKLKGLSGPAAISAFCGITEPAMYGVNLKYGRVFIMASIGGAAGGLLTGLLNVNMWGFTGSLIGFSSFVNPEGLDSSFWGYLIASGTSIVVAFVLTYLFGFKDSDADPDKAREVKKVRLGNREPAGTK
ncbi:PTS beta-glucoside transporter subunit IIABC [Corynebacterium yudongzhengii]|uniref:PTS beta-glucoside transporter subunit IIABC n=1 Tax=Corynebacterium yudongzhengii TaxID=2080740 RepID=A0A2U1T9P7_9CORY|nr:PTS glucose transporter subunit IIABC [Corynebacterium yudongzhengii]AWB81197.1 PTS beta-glucoside transporter subunit IIABC [Corynebacterium yudongzhengii]PWC02736.1 PTS beta-glucoside transporter subunit IIABC [Corynebacterium yudongzhengii]